MNITELTSDQLGNRNTVRDNTQRGEEIVKIELSKIIVREGFNVRQDYGDLESLANSILENGQVLPGRVDVLADGTFLLTDGHRRYKACLLLAERGEPPLFKAIVNTSKTTEEQRILQMFTTQDNKPLAPLEISELIQRLINLGYKQNEVAKKIGKTPAYVSQMLSLSNESPIIKEHVKSGAITASTAVKIQRAIPKQSERIEAVNKAVSAKHTSAPVSEADITGKKQLTSPEKLANAIAEFYGIAGDLAPMVNLIKSHL